VSRWKRVIGGGLRLHTDGRQATEVAIALGVLNRMLELGRPEYIRMDRGQGSVRPHGRSLQQRPGVRGLVSCSPLIPRASTMLSLAFRARLYSLVQVG
jgi:hypothetical protein